MNESLMGEQGPVESPSHGSETAHDLSLLSRDQLSSLLQTAMAFTSARHVDALLENVLEAAMRITQADGGTVYMIDENPPGSLVKRMRFHILRNRSLDIHLGGMSGLPIPDSLASVELFDPDGGLNNKNVASVTYHRKRLVNIDDAYHPQNPDLDFSGTIRFDEQMGYHSKSFLNTPLVAQDGKVLGIIQLINAKNDQGDTIPFLQAIEPLLLAFAGLAGAMVDAQMAQARQAELWESMVRMLASSIDQKSRYTSLHCQRVPLIARMLAQSVNDETVGPYADVHFDASDLYEINMAALLHDIGKVTTPESVMDKSTKLEGVCDRIHSVMLRLEILLRDEEIRLMREQMSGRLTAEEMNRQLTAFRETLKDEWLFIGRCNLGDEMMTNEDIARINELARRGFVCHFDRRIGVSDLERSRMDKLYGQRDLVGERLNVLNDLPEHRIDEASQPAINRGELYNLTVRRGTLNDSERMKINEHVRVTIDMLSQLPLPDHLPNLVEYAGNHHERIDGNGYPNELKGYQMSLPARMLCVADVFEALSAGDRPYKKAKKLSQCLDIMFQMACQNHLDRSLFQLFVRSGIYRSYAEQHMAPESLDAVDEARYLAEGVFNHCPKVPSALQGVQDSLKEFIKDSYGLPLMISTDLNRPYRRFDVTGL